MYVIGSGWCGDEWIIGLGLGFTNPVGTGGVLDVWMGWCYVCMTCEYGFFV